ncbi:MAG: TIGR01777 family oxidoreductase [Deltaproteobacteria bacterium]|nr:TIGR01777 family oxidoreductase [Deltaproteobacteria bacterium]
MRILISGASGLVGSHLIPHLKNQGHDVYQLVRSDPQSAHQIFWDSKKEIQNLRALEKLDAVIHLSGENIASVRWTEERKKVLRESRVRSTQVLVESISKLKVKPKHFLCASAIGFYGDRQDEILTEESSKGIGFLPELSEEWEKAALTLSSFGIRVLNLRLGIVVSSEGGALEKMLLPFKLGLAGKLGSGKQWMSWIDLEDVLRSIHFLIESNLEIEGPVNLVSPHPVTNEEWTSILGKLLKRPTILSMPAFAARIAFGEMADALLLASTRVQPKKLQNAGYVFQHSHLASAFRAALKLPSSDPSL